MRQICTAATNSCRSAARFDVESPLYCHWLCGQRVAVLNRPLIEHEWRMVRAFARRIKREDVRLRFGRPIDLRDEFNLRRYFDIGSEKGEIVLVLDEAGAVAGIGHRVIVSRSEAEIALLVRSDLKRRGIGEFLVREIMARSARQGIETLRALVGRENHAVLCLAAKLGCVPRGSSAFAVDLAFETNRPTAASCHIQ